jgi:hypothetical protein
MKQVLSIGLFFVLLLTQTPVGYASVSRPDTWSTPVHEDVWPGSPGMADHGPLSWGGVLIRSEYDALPGKETANLMAMATKPNPPEDSRSQKVPTTGHLSQRHTLVLILILVLMTVVGVLRLWLVPPQENRD